jgi:hypothetical protein
MAATPPNQYEVADLEGANGDPIEDSKSHPASGTTNDAVFGEVTEDGPNYRGVCHSTFASVTKTTRANMASRLASSVPSA